MDKNPPEAKVEKPTSAQTPANSAESEENHQQEAPTVESLQEAIRRHEQQRQELQAEADRLRQEVELLRDMAMRTQADLENYRKRVQRELEEERRFAELELIRDLLPVCDNLERALQAAQNTDNVQSLVEGFRLVAQQLQQVLRHHHCQRIDPQGEPFDPHQHEAVARQPTDQHPPQTVVEVVRAGYKLHDRVIRPAQVVVAAPASPGDGTTVPQNKKQPASGDSQTCPDGKHPKQPS